MPYVLLIGVIFAVSMTTRSVKQGQCTKCRVLVTKKVICDKKL